MTNRTTTASTINNMGYMAVDYAIVRKYTPQEPTVFMPGELVAQEPETMPESDVQVPQPILKDINMPAGFTFGSEGIWFGLGAESVVWNPGGGGWLHDGKIYIHASDAYKGVIPKSN